MLVQRRAHLMDAVLAVRLEAGEFFEQHLIMGIQKIAQNIDLGVRMLGGQLGSGDEFHLHGGGRRTGARTALNGVMVGQGDAGQALLLRVQHQFLGREGAVGKLGVQMEVGKLHFTFRAGRMSSPLILSRMPLTNLPLSCVENFLAMSTASLMLTTGGISSRSVSYTHLTLPDELLCVDLGG